MKKADDHTGLKLNGRYLELWVFSQITWELKSGDLAIEGSDQFSGYFNQLVSWEEPENEAVQIENGEPVLRRKRKEIPLHKLKTARRLIIDRLEPVTILDILIDTDRWLGWTKVFGLLSGFDSKIKDQASRYIVNTFCYGCNLGATHTARPIKKYDRKQIAWINQRHRGM